MQDEENLEWKCGQFRSEIRLHLMCSLISYLHCPLLVSSSERKEFKHDCLITIKTGTIGAFQNTESLWDLNIFCFFTCKICTKALIRKVLKKGGNWHFKGTVATQTTPPKLHHPNYATQTTPPKLHDLTHIKRFNPFQNKP